MTTATDQQQPGTAVEKKDNTPRGLIEQYRDDFAAVLPSHIQNPGTWIRVAQAALKKGKKVKVRENGKLVERFELEIAAANNPAAFLSALLDAARQGLEPGTEQYYLTPRMVKGQLEILGMRGYQGEVELIYRAGAAATVIVEAVRTNDLFIWIPGKLDDHQPPRWAGPMERPYHEVDWFGERGELKGVYAYAPLRSGAISKVVVLNERDIERIKSFAQGVNSEHSPWNTSTEAMWLKSAAHQLRKWVPTSAEYIREQYRAQAEATKPVTVPALRAEQDYGANPNYNGDQIFDAEIVDGVNTATGEIVDPDAAGDPDEPPDSFFEELNREAQQP